VLLQKFLYPGQYPEIVRVDSVFPADHFSHMAFQKTSQQPPDFQYPQVGGGEIIKTNRAATWHLCESDRVDTNRYFFFLHRGFPARPAVDLWEIEARQKIRG
jgi:hypothetical protein